MKYTVWCKKMTNHKVKQIKEPGIKEQITRLDYHSARFSKTTWDNRMLLYRSVTWLKFKIRMSKCDADSELRYRNRSIKAVCKVEHSLNPCPHIMRLGKSWTPLKRPMSQGEIWQPKWLRLSRHNAAMRKSFSENVPCKTKSSLKGLARRFGMVKLCKHSAMEGTCKDST